jgi:hypothetical protein
MAPKNRYNFGLNPLLKRDTAARERMLESTGGIPEMEYPEDLESAMSRDYETALPENLVTPEELKRRVAEKNKPVLPTDIEVRESAPEFPEFTPELAARVAREGTVRMSPQMARANLLPQENTAEADVVASQFPMPSLLGGQELSLGDGQAEESLPPSPAMPVTPSAAPVTPAALGAQPTRLEQLAKIVSMTSGAEMSPEDKRRAALADAIGKAQQAMYAGVTRSALPPTFFQQAATEQTTMNRLEQLYKASQILGQPKTTEPAAPGMILELKRQFPEASDNIPDEMSLTQFAQLSTALNRKRAAEAEEARLEALKQYRDVQVQLKERGFTQKEEQEAIKIIEKNKEDLDKAANNITYVKEIVDGKLLDSVETGSSLLNKLGAGMFTSEDEKLFDAFYENLVAPTRHAFYGANFTVSEQDMAAKMYGGRLTDDRATKLAKVGAFLRMLKNTNDSKFARISSATFNGKPIGDIALTNWKSGLDVDPTSDNPMWEQAAAAAEQATAAAKGKTLKQQGAEFGTGVKKRVGGAVDFLGGAVSGAPATGGLKLTGPVPQQAAQTPPPPDNSGNWRRVKKPSPGWYNTNTQDFAAD